jgi:hypothetical protein
MWAAISSVLLGVAAWLVASFFGKPLQEFYALRNEVHEEIIFIANLLEDEHERREQAVQKMRPLGAKLQSLSATAIPPLHVFLRWRGYDLGKAGGALVTVYPTALTPAIKTAV